VWRLGAEAAFGAARMRRRRALVYNQGGQLRALTKGAGCIVKLVTLGSDAVAYIREELVHPDPLADALRQLPLETGRVTSYVRSQTTDDELRKLRAVPKDPDNEGGRAHVMMIKFVYDYLQQGGKRVLIMGSHPTHLLDTRMFNHLILGRLGREWAEWVVCEERMYFCATEVSSYDRVHHVFDDVQAMTIFGVLASNLPRSVTPQEVVTQTALADVVRLADHVLVGAYDSGGMLIWSTQSAS
jgi:hypothetical protein